MSAELLNKNKVYKYFKEDRLYGITYLGVAYITDKQYVFRAKYVEDATYKHFFIIKEIDKWVHPGEREENITFENINRDNNVYMYMKNNFVDYDNECDIFLYIELPSNNELSKSQYMFICKILDEVDKFNSEVPDKRKVDIKYFLKNPEFLSSDFSDIEPENVDDVKRILLNFVTKDVHFDKEKIVGEVFPSEVIIDNMMFHININACRTFIDLIKVMELCDRYYNDDYYHDLFIKMFPNYENVVLLFEKIKYINQNDFDLNKIIFNDLSFENIYDVLSSICDYYGFNNTNLGVRVK